MPRPPLISSWEAKHRDGEPRATIRVRNLQASSTVGKDAWGRYGISKPILISAAVSFHDKFQVAVADDKLNDSTLHYGMLTKEILVSTAMFNETVPGHPEGKAGLTAFLNQLLLFLAGRELGGLSWGEGREPVLTPMAGLVKSVEFQIMLPKASLSGSGVSLTCIACYERAATPLDFTALEKARTPIAHALKLKLHDLVIPTLIGVNAYERTAKQMVVANVEIDEWDLAYDSYNELEQLVVKTIEESSFETLEALAELLYTRIIEIFLIPLIRADWLNSESDRRLPLSTKAIDWSTWKASKIVRIALGKPVIVQFAESPCVEIVVDAHPTRSDNPVVKTIWCNAITIARGAPPFPLQGTLLQWIQSGKGRIAEID